jgi:integrase
MSTSQTARQNARTNSNGKYGLPHWRKKIFKAYSVRDGKRYQSPNWMAAFSHQGKRESLSLETSNHEAAAARAKDLFIYLKANGWDKWREQFKPQSVKKDQPQSDATVGAYLQTARVVLLDGGCDPKTFQQYSQCLRHVAADIQGIGDRFTLGHDKWLEQVSKVPLSALTDDNIRAWKRAFLNRAKIKGEVELGHAMTTVNSTVRQCKALFSDRRVHDKPSALSRIRKEVELPGFVPFAGIGYEKRQSMKYKPSFNDVNVLTQAAHDELADAEPELYKIFWLALGLGLRRNEIDKLEWHSFRWNDGKHGVLRIEKTEFFKPKTIESSAEIPLTESFAALFRQYQLKAAPPARFVIECDGTPRKGAIHYYFRAQKLFERLTKWLRDHGVSGSKPLHELRKEFGSLVNKTLGIYAASTALRHKDIGITTQHYVSSEIQTLPGLDAMLNGPTNIVSMEGAA